MSFVITKATTLYALKSEEVLANLEIYLHVIIVSVGLNHVKQVLF